MWICSSGWRLPPLSHLCFLYKALLTRHLPLLLPREDTSQSRPVTPRAVARVAAQTTEARDAIPVAAAPAPPRSVGPTSRLLCRIRPSTKNGPMRGRPAPTRKGRFGTCAKTATWAMEPTSRNTKESRAGASATRATSSAVRSIGNANGSATGDGIAPTKTSCPSVLTGRLSRTSTCVNHEKPRCFVFPLRLDSVVIHCRVRLRPASTQLEGDGITDNLDSSFDNFYRKEESNSKETR